MQYTIYFVATRRSMPPKKEFHALELPKKTSRDFRHQKVNKTEIIHDYLALTCF